MRFFILLLVIIFYCLPASARPPSKINLTYAKEEKMLLIDIEHVSSDQNDHYIRRVIVYKNGEEVAKYAYPIQEKPTGQAQDVKLEAKVGDEIRVLAICSKAGRKEETLVITEDAK